MRASAFRRPTVRRVAAALVFWGAAWLLLGPALHLAVAGDGLPDGMPRAWKVAQPMPGDAGSYRIQGGPSVQLHEFDFEWVGWQSTLVEGRPGDVLEARILAADEPATPGHESHTRYRVGAGGVVLGGGPADIVTRSAPCPDTAVACTIQEKQLARSIDETAGGRNAIPCGLVHSLQWGAQDVAGPFLLAAACDSRDAGLVGQASEASRDAAGRLLLRIRATSDESPAMSFLLRPDIPYPLEIDPDADHDGPVLALTAFGRGSDAFALPKVEIVDPGELVMAPRDVLGPSEVGLTHEFPLSKALQEGAEEEPTLALFRLDHPDAYAARSSYIKEGDQTQGIDRLTWTVTLTDGTSNLDARITKVFRPVRNPLLDSVEVEILPPATERFPAPDLLPDDMPTAHQLLLRWGSYIGFSRALFVETPANGELESGNPSGGWNMTVACADPACSRASVEYHAGQNYETNGNKVDASLDPVNTDRASLACDLRFDEAGRIVSYVEAYRLERVVRGVPEAEGPHAQGEKAPVVMGNEDSTAATIAVVGAGVGSAFAALLYLLWPNLRALGFGLFSRIDRPKVFENPTRAGLFALIEQEPGIHFGELRRRIGVAHGTTVHHLRMLVANRLITARNAGGRMCYFAVGVEPEKKAAVLASSRHRQAFLAYLAAHPESTMSDVARGLGLRRQTVHESAARLARDGLIGKPESGRGAVRLTDLGASALRGAQPK